MMYEIVDYSPPPRKWDQIETLQVGKGFCVPWYKLEMYKHPQSILRTVACLYGKRLGRKFSTRKTAEGVWIYRVELPSSNGSALALVRR
jgi:hypothetical protein